MQNFKRGSIFLLLITTLAHANADANGDKLVQTINSFNLNLYKELIKTNDNLICSGYSVDTVLNMILVGARTTTESELRNVLGYESAGLSNNQVKDSYHALLSQQRSTKNGYDLDVANSMWIQQNFDVLLNFTKTIRDTFYAEEQQVHFGTSQATDTINNWVNKETKGKIPKLFDEPLDASTTLVLANAMYFKGTWITKFNSSLTKDLPFKSADGKANKQIPMMKVVSQFPYTESDELDAQVLELPYKGDDVSMYIVLPTGSNSLTSVETKVTPEIIKNVISNVYSQKVTVTIPKFKSSSTLQLNNALQNVGVKRMFGSAADLSGIDGQRGLFVSQVIQKAIIEVSEEGTVAAAATGASISRTFPQPPPKNIVFNADHPFMYFIVYKPSGLILFNGRFVKP